MYLEKAMSQSEINHAVAQVLGEVLDVVRRRGFGLVEPHISDPDFNPQAPSVIDWDATSEDEKVISLYEALCRRKQR